MTDVYNKENAFSVMYALRPKKVVLNQNVFSVIYELRLKKQLTIGQDLLQCPVSTF
jgi:hypothetical protein